MKLWFSLLTVFSVVAAIYGLPTSDFRSLIKPNTPENIEKLKNLGKDEIAELYSGQYQGDMIIEHGEERELEGRNSKAGLIATRYKWAGGVVPYRIIESDFSTEQIDYIKLGIKRLEEVSCLRFIAYDPRIHNDFVSVIGSDSGCYSFVGRRGTGEQLLNLQTRNNQGLETGCFRLYTIVHEFLHAVGFYHMHSASERDDWVDIVWDKISAGTENNFVKYAPNVVTNYGVDYDYGSVMHYPTVAFSTDGSPTIIPLRPLNGETMGQRVRLSSKDIQRVNRAYCEGIVETTTLPEPTRPAPPSIVDGINNWIQNLFNNIFSGFRP